MSGIADLVQVATELSDLRTFKENVLRKIGVERIDKSKRLKEVRL